MPVGNVKLNAIEAWRRLRSTASDLLPVHVVARLLVHTRDDGAPACPCCGCADVSITDDRVVDELIIFGGERMLRSGADEDKFDEIASIARRRGRSHVMNCRVADKHAHLVEDMQHSMIAIGGTTRAGKSTHGGVWLALQWLLWGGHGRRFWIVAPDFSLCHDIVNIIFKQQGDKSPVMPLVGGECPLLADEIPTLHSPTRRWRMIDGSLFEIRNFTQRRMGAVSVTAALFTEASKTGANSFNLWGDLVSRFTDERPRGAGRLWIESTAEMGISHWYFREVFKPAIQKQHSDTLGGMILAHDNPWLSSEAYDQLRTHIQDQATQLRMFEGQFVPTHGFFWDDVWNSNSRPGLSLAQNPHQRYDVSQSRQLQGLRDITREASTLFFRDPHDWLAGQDVNVNPCMTVLCKLFGTSVDDPQSWRLAVVKTYDTRNKITLTHAEALRDYVPGLATAAVNVLPGGGIFADTGIVIDATAYRDPSHSHSGGLYSTAVQGFERAGFEVRPPLWHPTTGIEYYPARPDSYGLLRWLLKTGRVLILEPECEELIRPLEEQEPDGEDHRVPLVRRKHRTDRLNASIDALRYLCWTLFSDRLLAQWEAQPPRFVHLGRTA